MDKSALAGLNIAARNAVADRDYLDRAAASFVARAHSLALVHVLAAALWVAWGGSGALALASLSAIAVAVAAYAARPVDVKITSIEGRERVVGEMIDGGHSGDQFTVNMTYDALCSTGQAEAELVVRVRLFRIATWVAAGHLTAALMVSLLHVLTGG